ncbi:peptidoglycan DD-metalloendopeptidase family protein [Paenibacillus allorhizosphaerae]|uniref:M23 family metallopeptidase n=1 Tax=Paenibacillus allorhizosphaerae TaxID=2849866 RepID=A0ABM8VLN0_9BACL|nr:peptidoglycan DD-metalloendopeptidase family protein [Paenibacillus allorhizosphaerae]CAG7648742.1 hypothetical protein PAECIP111802_04309 [Paenibacillus allorhizosphaerae]
MKDGGRAGIKTQGVIQWLLAFTVIVAVLVSGRLFVKAQVTTRYDVFLDDQLLGTVSDPELVKRWKISKYAEYSLQYDGSRVTSNLEELRFVDNTAFQGALDNDAVLAELNNKIMIAVFAAEIRIDGNTVGVVKDTEDAASLLERVKVPYMEKRKEASTLSAASANVVNAEMTTAYGFVQDVQVAETVTAPGKIESAETVLNRIITGDVKPVEYKVEKGDCISIIAQKFGIAPQVIYDNNPSIKNDLIKIGETLNLTVLQPLLAVKTVETRTEEVKVPSGIVYEKDSELKSGVIQIKSQGKPGLKKVTYETVKVNGQTEEMNTLNETMLEEPVQTVVRQGTKVIPGVGTGTFASPVLRAKITSEFGLRWGTNHNGTDLVSEQRAILASDHGKVVFAGVKSGYGNCIIIDHQNGFETLYGHLSKLDVRKGETVSKGEKIGTMGSTGNATGVHLHFEIIKSGEQQNPMKYVRL